VYPIAGDPVLLDVESGNLSVADEPIRRRATLRTKLTSDELTPAVIGDLLSPTSEFKLERGIKYNDGTSEYIPLGVFGVSDVQMSWDGEEVQATIDGYDRARKIIRSRMPNEYAIASGTNIKTGLQSLLSSRYTALQYSPNWVSYTTVATFGSTMLSTGDDAWEFARRVALDTLGADIFFDNEGKLTIQTITNPATTQPVWTYSEGSQAMLLAASKRLNDEQTYNHVVVTGEQPEIGTPVRAEAYDNNPSSPTYYLGPIGDILYFQASEFIKTTAQALAAAEARLNKVLGQSEEVRITSLPHPAHDVGDVIAVVSPRVKIDSVYVMDSFNIGLGHDQAMNVNTRKRRV
jgi:hypothetical protein